MVPTMFRFYGYTLDVGRGSLRFGEREVELRPKTFALLRYLVENADRLMTKDELITAIWPNVVVADESLTHCVSEVRRAIGDGDQTIIRTISRRGYRFAAPVSRLTKSSALQSSQTIGSCLLTNTDVHLPHEPAVFGRPLSLCWRSLISPAIRDSSYDSCKRWMKSFTLCRIAGEIKERQHSDSGPTEYRRLWGR